MHFPVLIIFLYAFTTEDRTYQFPPPGLTLHWFEVAFARSDIWAAMRLSLAVASRRHAAGAGARHARGLRAGAQPLSRQADASRCCSCCRSRCPASSPASRCCRRSSSPGSIRASGPSSRATPRSASSSSTTTSSRACAAFRRAGSRRRWISAPTAGRPSALRAAAAGGHGVARRRHARVRAVVRRDHRHHLHRRARAHAADLVLQRAVPAARRPGHERRRRDRDRGDADSDPAGVLSDAAAEERDDEHETARSTASWSPARARRKTCSIPRPARRSRTVGEASRRADRRRREGRARRPFPRWSRHRAEGSRARCC